MRPSARASKGDDARCARRVQVVSRLLDIVDRQIGRGERPASEVWSDLREMAAGYAGGLEAVAALESVVRKCEEQVSARIEAGEPDPARLRAGVVRFIHALVEKQLGRMEGSAATPPRR
jgi:hypothetical protein